jgi:formylglycine-generating enzyme required for sulfatase activity
VTADQVGRNRPCDECGHDFEPTDVPFGPAGRYLLKRYLHAGGMGIVFSARDTALARDVALKIPSIVHSFVVEERFKTEIKAAERLSHRNICSIYETSKWDGAIYYTMRFLGGGTLAERLLRGPEPGVQEASEWALAVAQAMAYAHGMGIVHRDLKPTNLMFDDEGVLIVTDFGLALFVDDPEATRITRPGDRVGSLPYMAPEQVRGMSDWHGPGCDIYALGVILYELLTGRRPFQGRGRELEDAILEGKPARPSRLRAQVPRELDRICLKAMALLIDDRYESMQHLADALSGYLGRASEAPPLPGLTRHDPARPAIFRCGRLGVGMARVPAGEFVMGSDEAEDERPPHRVHIGAPLLVGIFPVTQAEYKKVMGALPSSLFAGEDRRPVDSVSWLDAVIFCNLLSRLDRLNPYYKIQGDRVRILEGSGYRLLTEAEWEYACRSGGVGRYGFGDDPAELGRFAWFAENAQNRTHEVGAKEPNAFHLHDMLGNVWEWCWDWYARDSYRHARGGDDDRGGPASGIERVLRGGCWNSDAQSLRCAARIPFTPTELPLYYFGFRLARTITSDED